MKKGMKSAFAATLALTACFGGISAYAAHDENLNVYTLDTVVVEADKTKNKFGDTITEQSYYRTGGDVKVITREELDKRHYTDVTEAIKRIPGITFQNPGYRGGEYGYQFYNNGISINGDTRVVVLVDGRRVDNAASSRIDSSSAAGSKSTGVNLDQVTNMENVDKIEVIKGPGASVYGDDATGGVINIITRKGGRDSQGSIDLATGSWKNTIMQSIIPVPPVMTVPGTTLFPRIVICRGIRSIMTRSAIRTGAWKDPAGKKTVSMYGLIRISAIPKI